MHSLLARTEGLRVLERGGDSDGDFGDRHLGLLSTAAHDEFQRTQLHN
jgi:hypothetical protein